MVAIDPVFERSYEIKRDGRAQTVTRNRIHLRPMPSAKAGDDHDADAGAKKAQAKRKQAGHAQADSGGGSSQSSEPPTELPRSQRLRDRKSQQQ